MRSRLERRAAPVQRSLRAMDIGRPHATHSQAARKICRPTTQSLWAWFITSTRARAARSLDLSTKPRSRPIRRIRVMRFRSKARSWQDPAFTHHARLGNQAAPGAKGKKSICLVPHGEYTGQKGCFEKGTH